MFGHHAPLFVFSHFLLASIYCTNCQLSRTSNSFSQGNIHERHDQTGNTDVLNPADLHPFCGMLSCAMTRQAALVLLFVLAWRKNDEDLEAPWGYPA